MVGRPPLPTGWEFCSIGCLCDLINGRGFKRSERSPSGLPIIRIQNLNNPNASFNYYDGEYSEGIYVCKGDMLFAWSGTPGTSFGAHIWNGPEGLLNQHIYRVLPDDEVIAKDYFVIALNNKLAELIEGAHGGVGLRHITKPKLEAAEIGLPPLNEQRRIADKIDALQAKSRRAHEALEAVGPLLEKFQQSVLAAAFRGDLTAEWRKQHPDVEPAKKLLKRIPAPQQGRGGKMPTATVIKGRAAISVNDPQTGRPEGWEWISLLRVARQETGHTPSRKHPEYWDGDIPWLAIPDAGEHHGGFIYETHQHVTQEGLNNSSARLLPKDTVCLSRTASVGYIVIMGRAMATSQDFVTWTCSEALDPEYLMYALLAEGDHIKKFGKGSTHTTIYFPEVRALHICLAPIEEQREIVRIVKVTLGKYEKAATNVAAMHEGLTTLDQSILAKAFRGELVPQDPNDEPASVLLERIKAERGAATGRKRTRRKG